MSLDHIKKLFKKGSETRTQIFVVFAFIILPLISLAVVFYVKVLDEPRVSSQRLAIPPDQIKNFDIEKSLESKD